jgi:hypothetical protein
MLGSSFGRNPAIRGGMFGASTIVAEPTATQIGTRDELIFKGIIRWYAENQPTFTQQQQIAAAQTDYDKKYPAGTSTASVDNAIVNQLKSSIVELLKMAPGTTNDAIRSKFVSQGYTQSQIDAAMGFDMQANMPYLIIGGAALIAVLFMVGSKRR